jgi:hypothetical protein
MTNDTVKHPKAQDKALIAARRDAVFRRLMLKVLRVAHNSGQRFESFTVEGFRHA